MQILPAQRMISGLLALKVSFGIAKVGGDVNRAVKLYHLAGASFIIICLSGKSGGAPNVFMSNFILKRFMCSSP